MTSRKKTITFLNMMMLSGSLKTWSCMRMGDTLATGFCACQRRRELLMAGSKNGEGITGKE